MSRHISDLQPALDTFESFMERFKNNRIAVFLDYDGTLTPITERPEHAVLSKAMRENLCSLAKRHTVSIVSGRDLEDVKRLIGLDDLIYAGNHGFQISGPANLKIHHQKGKEFHDLINNVEVELRRKLGSLEGVLIENKKFSVTAHYRMVIKDDHPKISEAVQSILLAHPQLRITTGKMIYEIQPRLNWNKGKAVLWLLQALKLDTADVTPIYIGDDVTDEDAFKAIESLGIGIFVGNSHDLESKRSTSAHLILKNPDEVGLLLQLLV